MEIKLVGSNCSNGTKLKKILNKIIKRTDYKIDLNIVDDEKKIKKLNVKNKPGLIINDVLVSQGKTHSDKDILKYLKLINESNA